MIKEPFSACFWPWNFNNPVKVKYHKLTGSLTLHKFFYVIWYFAVSQSALFQNPISNISFQRLLRMVEMMFLDQRRHLYPHKRYNKEDVTPFRTRLFGLAGRWIQNMKKIKKYEKNYKKFGRTLFGRFAHLWSSWPSRFHIFMQPLSPAHTFHAGSDPMLKKCNACICVGFSCVFKACVEHIFFE